MSGVKMAITKEDLEKFVKIDPKTGKLMISDFCAAIEAVYGVDLSDIYEKRKGGREKELVGTCRDLVGTLVGTFSEIMPNSCQEPTRVGTVGTYIKNIYISGENESKLGQPPPYTSQKPLPVPTTISCGNPKLGQPFEKLVDFIKNYQYFKHKEEYEIFLIWTLLANNGWILWEAFPHIWFHGYPKSGKSNALSIIKAFSGEIKATQTASISSAAISRSIKANNYPILLIDELEQRNDRTELLWIIINAGYKKGSRYITCDLKNQEKLYEMDIHTPMAIASIKVPPSTTATRCIVFNMNRSKPKKSYKSCDPEWLDYRGIFGILSELLYNEIVISEKANQMPKMPEFFDGRDEEVWQPILYAAWILSSETYDKILNYAKEYVMKTQEEEKTELKVSILRILVKEKNNEITAKELIQQLEEDFPETTTQKIGYQLKTLGCNKHIINGRAKYFWKQSDIEEWCRPFNIVIEEKQETEGDNKNVEM